MNTEWRLWGSNRLLAAALAVIVTAIMLGGSASVRAAEPIEHCVVDISASQTTAGGPARELGCFASLDDALAVVARRSSIVPFASWFAPMGATTIGTHYKGLGYTGSSITIVGTTCSGGTWKPTGTWNNAIKSSLHHCGSKRTYFYDTASCGGDMISINQGAPTLIDLNDKTSCVRYGL